MMPVFALALILTVSEFSLLVLRGYSIGPALLLASVVSFLLYLAFFLLLRLPFLLFRRKRAGNARSIVPFSLALSMAILTFAALDMSGKISGNSAQKYAVPLLLSACAGVAYFALLALFARQLSSRLKALGLLPLVFLSFFWRMEVAHVPPAEKPVALPAWGEATREGSPNVILIVVDTLRRDRLGCYGNDDSLTPAIDGLRKDSILFRNAIVTCPRTAQSMSSFMTGLYPSEHGVRRIFDRLGGNARTLAEILREGGYDTFAVVSNPVLRRATSGLSQGFHRYDDAFLPTPFNQELPLRLFETFVHRIRLRNFDATSTTDRAIESLRTRAKDRPFFLWIQYFDPHWIYLPPAEYIDLAEESLEEVNEIYEELDEDRLEMETLKYRHPYTESLLASFRELYDGEVRFCDDQIGRLLSFLKSEGLYESTLIVFTADHGEGLGEHNYYFDHGLHLFEEEVGVPLLVKLPSDIRCELDEFDAQVSIVDFLQNLLHIIGLTKKTGGDYWFARSNGTLSKGETSGFVFGESDTPPNWGETAGDRRKGRLRMIRDERYKLIYNPSLADDEKFVLYDLEADPAERMNIYEESHPEAQILLERLKEWYGRTKESEKERSEEIDKLLMEDLKALGYFH